MNINGHKILDKITKDLVNMEMHGDVNTITVTSTSTSITVNTQLIFKCNEHYDNIELVSVYYNSLNLTGHLLGRAFIGTYCDYIATLEDEISNILLVKLG